MLIAAAGVYARHKASLRGRPFQNAQAVGQAQFRWVQLSALVLCEPLPILAGRVKCLIGVNCNQYRHLRIQLLPPLTELWHGRILVADHTCSQAACAGQGGMLYQA